MAGPRPEFSLVVCTVDRTASLRRLLDSLLGQQCVFEVLVVDQSDGDEIKAVIHRYDRDLDLRHLESSRGLSKARNAGLAVASGEIIGFPDDDCWYPGALLRRVSNEFAARPDTALLLGRTVDAQWRESLSSCRTDSGKVSRRNVWVSGNSNTLFARRSAAQRIGPFDETLGVGASTSFQSGEETDYLLRALELGLTVEFLHDLVVHHDQVTLDSCAARLSRVRAYAPGFGRLVKKHHLGRPYLFGRVLRAMGTGSIALARRRPFEARLKYEWARGVLSGYMARY